MTPAGLVIMLYVGWFLPGEAKPTVSQFPMASAEECLEQAADILIKAQGLRRPGSIEVACSIKVETVEHSS